MEVIRAENLTKEYRLGTINHGYLFRDLQSIWARIRKRPDPNRKLVDSYSHSEPSIYRALDDVSFSIAQGEAVGIIGRNGAGKSTLLKILSRITTPTSGTVRIRGRVASLLEVGTGFHPELSGRENIFLNGAILGMSRREIQSKFDEIVDFAEIQQFIDTPVKRYSSGMYVRLAFAVAAHLDPEILIVDEVLAVGDYKFQKKCIGKMGDLSRGTGATILFVSHNLAILGELTTKSIMLDTGRLVTVGPTPDVISVYTGTGNGALENSMGYFDFSALKRNAEKHLRSEAELASCTLHSKTGSLAAIFGEREPIEIRVKVLILKPVTLLSIEMSISDEFNNRLFAVVSDHMENHYDKGEYLVTTTLDPNFLRTGRYYGSLTIRTETLQDGFRDGFAFEIVLGKADSGNTNALYDRLGAFKFPYAWRRPERLHKFSDYKAKIPTQE